MEYHVERVISRVEIAQCGEDVAIASAQEQAWLIAVRGAHPKRSLKLIGIEECQGQYNGVAYGLTYRYHFAVDE